ncbi:MAG: exodeoxyribonuclease I [Gammaproteobacteria bacterium]|nr:exodeoxyribonuclease I [Gammaproteobacteria bacterium]
MRFRNPTSKPRESFYWYDLETTGKSSRHDRIIQLASQRTDKELQPIGEPYTRLVRVPPEVLLKPEAMLITKIGPGLLECEGMEEWNLLRDLSDHLAQPQTCLVGYNNVSFDDEFLRFSMYRNLRPPYEHEWKRGNSRMDMMSILQLTCALRPEGMRWPIKDGEPSYTLSDLAEANEIDTSNAHDAQADVDMTLSLARLVKQTQPKLWDYVCSLRSKETAIGYTTPLRKKPLLHVSKYYSKQRYCIAPVLPIVVRPNRSNEVISVDLNSDLSLILKGSIEDLRSALFSSEEERDPSQPRPGIHTITLNKFPMIAPLSTLRDEDAKRLNIDKNAIRDACTRLNESPDLPYRLQQLYEHPPTFEAPQTAEEALYDGFLPDEDLKDCREFWRDLDRGLPWRDIALSDNRLNDLRSRLKAHVAPEQMDDREKSQYRSFVKTQLTSKNQSFGEVRQKIQELRSSTQDVREMKLLDELDSHMTELAKTYEL